VADFEFIGAPIGRPPDAILCPFCGCTDIEVGNCRENDEDVYLAKYYPNGASIGVVACSNCPATIVADSVLAAVLTWNRRADTMESASTSTNIRSVGEAPQICRVCGGHDGIHNEVTEAGGGGMNLMPCPRWDGTPGKLHTS
jgi:hypothetical protein